MQSYDEELSDFGDIDQPDFESQIICDEKLEINGQLQKTLFKSPDDLVEDYDEEEGKFEDLDDPIEANLRRRKLKNDSIMFAKQFKSSLDNYGELSKLDPTQIHEKINMFFNDWEADTLANNR